MLTCVPLALSLSLKGAHRWWRIAEPTVITSQARAFAIKLGGEMSFLWKGTPKSDAWVRGNWLLFRGAREMPPHSPGRGCGRWDPARSPGFAGLGFATSISPLQSGFINRSVCFHSAAFFLLFLVLLLSSLATGVLMSRMWTRYCRTCYDGDAMLVPPGDRGGCCACTSGTHSLGSR